MLKRMRRTNDMDVICGGRITPAELHAGFIHLGIRRLGVNISYLG